MANAEASAPLARQLAEERIIIRDCSDFPGLDPSYFRVAVRLPGENQRLANALARVLAKSAAHAPPEVC
ncbi:MAG TPA: hypothetical protein GX513_08925 [Firmicutes bacterium]|nr:hypothetical protein [Bacillota bacterium]